MNQSAPVTASLNEIGFVIDELSAAGKDLKLDDRGAGDIPSKYNKFGKTHR